MDIQRFINRAAQTPEQLRSPEWIAGFHNQILKAAFNARKTAIEQADLEQSMEYWINELPALADRTRSSITTQVMVFSTSCVTDMYASYFRQRPISRRRLWMQESGY